MKYGESTFDVAYLLFAVITGIWIIRKSEDRPGRLMGIAAVVLGCGDAFHLVPRVLNYFSGSDLTAALGIGKFVTSVTMTIFYVIMYHIWLAVYEEEGSKALGSAVYGLSAMRIALCLFPQNGWLVNSGSVTWAILRNIPFVVLGIMIIVMFYRKRKELPVFNKMWLLITLSFAFYIPVAVGAGLVPILGMLMLPKTVCYILMIVLFVRYTNGGSRRS